VALLFLKSDTFNLRLEPELSQPGPAGTFRRTAINQRLLADVIVLKETSDCFKDSVFSLAKCNKWQLLGVTFHTSI